MMPDLEEGDALELPPPETELVIKTNQKLGEFYDILEELGK